MREGTIILGEKSFVSKDEIKAKNATFIELNLVRMAEESGNKIYANIILFGYIAGMIGLDKYLCQNTMRERFSKLETQVIEGNVNAFGSGYKKGASRAPRKVSP